MVYLKTDSFNLIYVYIFSWSSSSITFYKMCKRTKYYLEENVLNINIEYSTIGNPKDMYLRLHNIVSTYIPKSKYELTL